MRNLLRIGLKSGALMALAAASQAKPEYAKKENKPCGYCHTKPEGGGARNPRGVYYAMHKHTFEGYDEAKVMGADAVLVKKTGAPSYKSAWKVDVPAGAKRIAIGDVAGDKTPRLLVVNESGKLTIHKLGESGATEEASIDLGKEAGKVVVGNFAKGKPAVIVVPGAVYYRDGEKYAKKAAADLTNVTGSVRFVDGTENFFIYEGGMPEVYGVDLTGAKVLVAGQEMPNPEEGAGTYADINIHPPISFLNDIHIPEEAQKAGTIGIYDPRNEKKLFIWLPWADKSGANMLVVAEFTGLGADVKPSWTSPKLAGRILDVASATNPKNPKQGGLAVLMATGADGKGRTVEFFALD